MDAGIVVSGNFSEIYIRKHPTYEIEVGELLVAASPHGNILYQVTDLLYGSQIAPQQLELIAGMKLEDSSQVNFFDEGLRNYIIACAKPLLLLSIDDARPTKVLPTFFSAVRPLTKEDMHFMIRKQQSLHLGKLRSGSRVLDIDVCLDARDVLSHHVLVSATTGKGKSNLIKNLLFSQVTEESTAFLVFDPHDEYYGRHGLGLKDHPCASESVIYYSHDPLPLTNSLRLSVRSLSPSHLSSIATFSQAQTDTMYLYYRQHHDQWIAALFNSSTQIPQGVFEETVHVIRRKLGRLLQISPDGKKTSGIFTLESEQSTLRDILESLVKGKTVIVDTSSLAGQVELLVNSIITSHVFEFYRLQFRRQKQMPIVSIVLEEAPRVIGKDVLENGSNVFGTIAREGRKFGVGMVAITQLPSLIPRDILANLSTKIILGTEIGVERQALIESAAQDLSKDQRAIASLDKGEAIITSNFARFAVPVRARLFKDLVVETQNNSVAAQYQQSVTGLKQ